MSVDFSQFFNGPIRDSLIAQVSGYLDISRPQATTAYDKAVALVIGAMAQQAGKPEGAQALAAHIQDSQTQTSLTSSALSPTVLTNDQFAQIVTLGESEQAIILGQQQEAVTAHLEVATGLDTKAVGSLLSIVVPFVLSFLKNNITTESEPAQSLPVLFATQAPHVAAQLDAPALAALGQDSLEGLFGRDALAAADANTAATSQNGKPGSAQGATTHEKPANGWFKWVLTLAVVLAGAAWIKSCTQSDTTTTENAKPADQQQSAADAPASDAATAPAAAPANNDKMEPGDATAPSANFPEPASSQSAGVADAPAAESAQTDSAQADSAKPESAQTKGADTPATAVAPAATASAETTESKQNTETVPPAGEKPDSEQSASAGGQPDAPVTDSAQPETSATAAPEAAADTSNTESTNDANDGQTAGPTYGQASDTMEPEAQSDATAAAVSADAASTDAANAEADKATEQKAPSPAEQANTDNTKPAATAEDSKQANQVPAPAAEGATATSTAPDVSSATAEQTGSSSAATANTAADSATTDTPAADTAAPGKTTTFAEPAPLADKSDTPPAASTPELAGAAGKTTTFAASDSSGSQPEPAQPQETKADQAADTQSGTAPASDGVAPSSTTTASSGKTTTFGVAEQDDSASADATQTDSDATAADSADQPPVAADSATGSAQSGAAAQVELERDGDVLRIRGTVPDESARNRILNAAKFVDGHSKIEDELQVDSQARASKFDDYSGLLSLLRGYHDVNVSLKQDVLTLTGQVSSSEENEALTTKVQNLVGADIQVDNQVDVAAPARAAAPDAAAASAAPPQVQFASGSAQVDNRFHDGLDQYAQQLIESGKSVQLVGFADESGSEPGNEALSKRRAESVKAYLILRGVQAQQIQTEGQGTQAPVADNTTEAGRAKNRRVEIHEQQ